jgi:hypothetical protein
LVTFPLPGRNLSGRESLRERRVQAEPGNSLEQSGVASTGNWAKPKKPARNIPPP